MSSYSMPVTAASSQVQPRSRVLLGLIGLCLCYWGQRAAGECLAARSTTARFLAGMDVGSQLASRASDLSRHGGIDPVSHSESASR